LRTRLFGPERELSAARDRLARAREWWSAERPLKANLAALFGVDSLPPPQASGFCAFLCVFGVLLFFFSFFNFFNFFKI
jgi:hypothetical protein